MDEDKKKVVMIVIIVLCIGLAAGITYWTNRGGGFRRARTSVPMVCANSKCGYKTELTIKEYSKLLDEQQIDGTNPRRLWLRRRLNVLNVAR